MKKQNMGKPVTNPIKEPQINPIMLTSNTHFLTSAEQQRYEEACKSFGAKAQASLNIEINGSNLFKVLLLNQIGIRTATLSELDLIARTNPKFLTGTYEDGSSCCFKKCKRFSCSK